MKTHILDKELIALTKMIATDFTNKQSKIDINAAEKLIEPSVTGSNMVFHYFLGKYLTLTVGQQMPLSFGKNALATG